MRWCPIYKQLPAPDAEDVLIELGEATLPTVTTISITTTHAVYLHFGPCIGPMTPANSFLLLAGEGYAESGIMVSGEIRFVNAVPGEQPTVRGIVWGR